MINRKLIAAVAVLAVAVPQAASANTIVVNALALQTCLVTATPMAFGSVSPGVAAVDSTSTLNLVCTPNAQFDVLLNNGQNAEGSQRQMKGGLSGEDEFIPYNLYIDAARTNSWGNTVGTDTQEGSANALGVAQFTVYGQIPLTAKPVSAGAYTDLVTVSVAF